MKLNFLQLEQHLAKTIAPIYIIGGEELLLKQDAIKLIRKTAKQAGYTERLRVTPGTDMEWDDLYNTLYANSLFAEKRLLELDCSNSAPTKPANELLQEYASKPSTDLIILIEVGKIDDKISRTAWYKAIEKAGMVVTLWPIPREQLPQWIMNRAKKYKLTIPPDAANCLADYVEGNITAASQTIEKLYLLKPDTAITVDLINTVLADESRFNVFDFIEQVIAGNQSRALHALDNLKNDGTEPILVLWGMTRELRILANLAQEVKQGVSYETLFQKHRIFFKRQTIVRQFLTKFTAEDCWHHLQHGLDIDRIIKGAAIGDAWDQLQLFCLRINPAH
jgi:DNA polymerase-3 subunit delta